MVKVISLRSALEVIREKTGSDKLVVKKLSDFSCGVDEEDDFIHRDAISYEDHSKARTYLLIDSASNKIISFFSIAIKSVEFNVCSKTIKKKLLAGDSKESFCSAYLIGHFAKNEEFKELKIGKTMLDIISDLIGEARKIVGGRFVYLDCEKDNDKLHSYYESFGFKYFNESSSGMSQYYLKFN